MLDFIVNNSPLLYLTQSLWRDEVFSLFMAAKPISFFITKLNFEPPLYYLLLHFWMKLFGMGEIAGRSLSLVAHTGATVIVIFWAEKIFKKHWMSWWLALFFFFNPMLLYYGMELRTYGWYTFFATLSLYAYSEKKWALWVGSTLLGFYTHTFLIIVPFAQTVHYLLTNRKRIDAKDPMVRSLIVLGIGIAPWALKIIKDAGQLKTSWYYPVDLKLAASALGNLFVGYEGTPWYLWRFTKLLSLVFLATSVLALISKKTRSLAGLFAAQVYLPLFLVIGISFVKPFYVNRYMIAVTVGEVFLIGLAIFAIKNTVAQKLAAAVALLFIIGFNIWYPSKHAKLDMRSVLGEINAIQGSGDIVLAESPLILFEATYYSHDPKRVFLYNPYDNPFPWHVGDAIVSSEQMVNDYPPYPTRAFFVREDGTFTLVFRAPMHSTAYR